MIKLLQMLKQCLQDKPHQSLKYTLVQTHGCKCGVSVWPSISAKCSCYPVGQESTQQLL